jgi:hypothetical protein
MDTRRVDGRTDERIRDLYRESALRADMALFTDGLRERLAAQRPRRGAAALRRGAGHGGPASRRSRLRDKPLRLALAAIAGVVVLGAVGFGVYEAVERLGRHTPVLVIGDDSMLGSTAAPSAYDAVLPAGVSAAVGTSGSSLWCLSRELGYTSLEVGALPVLVATGTTGDLVAYTTRESGADDVLLWDANETGADEGVKSIAAGDASQPITLLSMSPDGTKLAVARGVTPDAPSWDGHLYIVDLATGAASDWQWAEGDAPPAGATPTGSVWSPASDAFYVSFMVAGNGTLATTSGSTYRCDLASSSAASIGDLGTVEAASATGLVVGLVLDSGPMGMLSSAWPEPSLSIWRDGEVTSVKPATQRTFGPVFISADGESMLLRDYADVDPFSDYYDPSAEQQMAIEVMRNGEAGWTTAEWATPPSLSSGMALGFSGGNEFYFVAEPEDETSDDLGHPRLGVLDPVTGDCRLFEDLPVEGNSQVVGLWTQPSTPDETPDETAGDTSTTTSTTELSSAPVPVTSTASLPLAQVEGTTVFSAGWGSGAGQFGIQTESVFGLLSQGPGSLWVTPDERLYILDPSNHRVQVVGADGTVGSAVPIDMEYPIDVAAAADGTVLVFGLVPDPGNPSMAVEIIQAYSAAGEKLGEYPAAFDDAWPLEFSADESTVYCAFLRDVGQDTTDAPLSVTKYVPVYRDGELLDPAAGWAAASYDRPLGNELSLRVGDHPPGEGAASESIGNIHVYSGDQPVFSSDLIPADYGAVTGLATDAGEVLVARQWIVSDDSGGTHYAHAVWAYSPAGTPLRRVEVLQGLLGTSDSSGGSRSRLSRSGGLFMLTTTADGAKVIRYDLGGGGASQLATLPESMPADFGFVAKYGWGGMDAIDTVAGTVVKDLIDNGTVGARLSLTSADLQELYRGLIDLDILGYPSHFQPAPGASAAGGLLANYYLEIRLGGTVTKFVLWQDLNASTQPEAVALRAWFATLQAMIEAKPEWQALPPAVGVHEEG